MAERTVGRPFEDEYLVYYGAGSKSLLYGVFSDNDAVLRRILLEIVNVVNRV
jgi:hypothetical protein